MSYNQSRSDKNEPPQNRRSGRSGNPALQRNLSGGGGRGGGNIAPPSFSQPANSNRGGKKVNNAQGGQSRAAGSNVNANVGVNLEYSSSAAAAATRAVPNGAHSQPSIHGAADVPMTGTSGKYGGARKTVKITHPDTHEELRLVRTYAYGDSGPSSNIAAPRPDTTAPATPAKAPGDPSRSFPLQFGSISPGFMNGMGVGNSNRSIPRREASSAPPQRDSISENSLKQSNSTSVLLGSKSTTTGAGSVPAGSVTSVASAAVDESVSRQEAIKDDQKKPGKKDHVLSHNQVGGRTASVSSLPSQSLGTLNSSDSVFPETTESIPASSSLRTSVAVSEIASKPLSITVGAIVPKELGSKSDSIKEGQMSSSVVGADLSPEVEVQKPEKVKEQGELLLKGSKHNDNKPEISSGSTPKASEAVNLHLENSELKATSVSNEPLSLETADVKREGAVGSRKDDVRIGKIVTSTTEEPNTSYAETPSVDMGSSTVSHGDKALVSDDTVSRLDRVASKSEVTAKGFGSIDQELPPVSVWVPETIDSERNMLRNNIDSDRWQRSTSLHKGLIPSSQTPLQVLHKAERKYEVGKITDEEQAKTRQLKAILKKVTPQNFEKLFEQVKQVNIDNAGTLSLVVALIFDKALMEPTFCEMYANFCYHLAGELPDFSEDNEKITFKRLLLNKCQEEFERGEREQEEANRAEEEGEVKQTDEEREEKRIKARRRLLGNIRLIGELYKKRMLTERIMHACIQKLLGEYQNPDEEDVEALCELMSTIGEMIDHPKAKEHMDAYFEMMYKLSNNMKLSSRVRFLLKDSIDLRKNKWQQRRKVEGPKMIDEVQWDAAQERQAQSIRLARGPSFSSSGRRGQPTDFAPRGSKVLPSPNSQMGNFRGLSQPLRGYANQDAWYEERHAFETRPLSVPLRPVGDEYITLGPQGGLARGMSSRGQPSIQSLPTADMPSPADFRRATAGPNGYSSVSERTGFGSREDLASRYTPERFVPPSANDHSSDQERNMNYMSWDTRNVDRTFDRPPPTSPPARGRGPSLSPIQNQVLPEERLQEKSIEAIKEYYRSGIMSTDGNGSKTLKVTDRRSPFFLHPSDNPGIMLMNVVLRRDSNYETWAKAMKNALKAKNKLGFINGTILQPDDSESDEGFAWGPNNSMINGWIHNTIDPQLQPFIPYFDTAKELWDDIKERYAVQNIPRQYQLKSSLATTKQAGSSVQNYYTKLRAVWDELESSRTVPACPSGDACPVTKWVSEETQRDHVYQFLMGLDEGVFGNLRTQILSTTPLPSVNRLYSMAAQEETHKAIARGCEERVEAVGYAVQAMSKVAAVPSVSKVADGLGGNKIERVICTHCGKPNHDVSKCFQLHCYTNKGKGKAKGKGTQHHVTAHAVQAIADGGSGSSGAVGVTDAPVLTGKLLQRLINLVESSNPSSTEKMSGKGKPLPFWLRQRSIVPYDWMFRFSY